MEFISIPEIFPFGRMESQRSQVVVAPILTSNNQLGEVSLNNSENASETRPLSRSA